MEACYLHARGWNAFRDLQTRSRETQSRFLAISRCMLRNGSSKREPNLILFCGILQVLRTSKLDFRLPRAAYWQSDGCIIDAAMKMHRTNINRGCDSPQSRSGASVSVHFYPFPVRSGEKSRDAVRIRRIVHFYGKHTVALGGDKICALCKRLCMWRDCVSKTRFRDAILYGKFDK